MTEVKFQRTRSNGLRVNFWIKHGDNDWRKLVFRNDKARADLEPGRSYTMFWQAFGKEGDGFTVNRKIAGVDNAFAKLFDEWKIPDQPDIPPGVPLRFNARKDFTL